MKNEFLEQALERLKEKGSFGRHEDAMKAAVGAALGEFCRQDAEFAQAVAQGGKFSECMKAVAKNVGGSISDLEAFRRAVTFYFPGATVEFQMKIDVCPNRVGAEPEPVQEPKILDLEAFF